MGESGGQRSLACCSPWGCRVRHNLAIEQQPRSKIHLKCMGQHLAHSRCSVNISYYLFCLIVSYRVHQQCPGHLGLCYGPCLHLTPKPTPVRKAEFSTWKLLGIEALWWGYSQAGPLSCSMNVPICPSWAMCRNVYGDLICFPFCGCCLPKARNRWN